MKILVTGANGYVGQGVVNALLNRGAKVVATDFACDHVNEAATLLPCNLFEVENPYEYFGKPDCIIHLAWRDGFKHASINHINDLPLHYAFLEKMASSGIKQMVVMGTMHEVGFYEGSIDENSPCHPQSLYGIAKNALRHSVELLQKDYDFVYQWLRGYYIVGNTRFGCSIFSKITQAADAGETHFPFTSGQNQFDFIDYDLFCDQIAATALQTKVTGIINCCSGHPMKLAERVEQFIKENNYDIILDYGKFPDRPYDSKAVWGNNNKISEIME
ncbi:MAG: NAD(P)-dependent oxidoreductase [Pseudobutyrivibrio sp.]|nr:NAD(P)-dependent oxidoreductase [Pseudobutyrivibrio sp.]